MDNPKRTLTAGSAVWVISVWSSARHPSLNWTPLITTARCLKPRILSQLFCALSTSLNEHQCQDGVLRNTATGLVGSEAHGSKGRFKRMSIKRIFQLFTVIFRKITQILILYHFLAVPVMNTIGDLKPGCYHHLSFSLALLFYLGSVARYRPTEVEDLLVTELCPLISEAIAVIPQHFLYQMLGYITNNVCVIPQSKL